MPDSPLMTQETPQPTPAMITKAAGAIVDLWLGNGRTTDWRDRLDESDFLESADWARAVEYATAALGTLSASPQTGTEDAEMTIEQALSFVPDGWSWSLGEMMGLPEERRFRCFLSDHNTLDGMAKTHCDEDRNSPVVAILAAVEKLHRLWPETPRKIAVTPPPKATDKDVAQPMETAPRDGTPILVFFDRHYLGWQRVTWDDPHGDGSYKIWCVDDNKHGPYPLRGYLDGDEKGWLTLPEQPAIATLQEGQG